MNDVLDCRDIGAVAAKTFTMMEQKNRQAERI
jgi:hypothetical protein